MVFLSLLHCTFNVLCSVNIFKSHALSLIHVGTAYFIISFPLLGNFIILQVQILLLYNNIDVDCVNMIKWHNRPN